MLLLARHSKRIEHSFYQPEIQTMPIEKLRELQLERLREKIKIALEKPVPFWKRKLNEGGISSPNDIQSLEDLTRIPVTVKDEFRESDRLHPPFGDYRVTSREGVIMLGTSSGSTGTPTTTLWTKNDLEAEMIAAARNNYRGGLRPGMWVVHAHPFGLYGGSTLLTLAYQYMGICPIAVGTCESDAELERVLRYLEQITPDGYTIFEPAHRRFYSKAVELGLDLDKLNLPDPNTVWPQKPNNVSGGIDSMAFLGSVCQEANGAHICEDLAIVEAIDPVTYRPVPDGERGLLTITTITKDNFVIRYNVEDVIRILPGDCPCGETHRRAVWDGREKDIVIVKGKRLLPIDLDAALLKYSSDNKQPVMLYQMVRTNKGVDHNVLRVRLENEKEGTSDADSLQTQLSSYLSETLDVPVFVELVPKNTFPKDAFKRTYVVDDA